MLHKVAAMLFIGSPPRVFGSKQSCVVHRRTGSQSGLCGSQGNWFPVRAVCFPAELCVSQQNFVFPSRTLWFPVSTMVSVVVVAMCRGSTSRLGSQLCVGGPLHAPETPGCLLPWTLSPTTYSGFIFPVVKAQAVRRLP